MISLQPANDRGLAHAHRGGSEDRGSRPENRPLLLVSGATATVRRYAAHPHLGRLIQPRNGNRVADLSTGDLWWAADNDCFQGLDPDAYLNMLSLIATTDTRKLLFVTVPDVVADSHGTFALFCAWLPALRKRNLPIALVAQDGLTSDQVPWGELAALFIGGSTTWKEGPEAAALIHKAHEREVWIHIGRVNTERLLRYFDALGIDSFDGTQFSMFPETYIPRWLRRLEHRQIGMVELL
jgi:hypothetical protein